MIEFIGYTSIESRVERSRNRVRVEQSSKSKNRTFPFSLTDSRRSTGSHRSYRMQIESRPAVFSLPCLHARFLSFIRINAFYFLIDRQKPIEPSFLAPETRSPTGPLMKSWPRLLSDLRSSRKKGIFLRNRCPSGSTPLAYLRGTIVFFSKRKKKGEKREPFQNGRRKKRKKLDKMMETIVVRTVVRAFQARAPRAIVEQGSVLKRSVAVELVSLFLSLLCSSLEREKEGESFPWRAQNRTITCHVCVLSRNSKTAAAEVYP